MPLWFARILALVGAKMLAQEWLKERFGPNFNFFLLGMVALILVGGVVVSLLKTRGEHREGLATGDLGTVHVGDPTEDAAEELPR